MEQSRYINDLKAYYGSIVDNDSLKKSASGGAATVLAEMIIREAGVVFGVGYSSDYKSAHYYCIRNIDDLDLIKGSKYITSEKKAMMDGTFIPLTDAVKKFLLQGKKVIFFGLGCDIALVKKFCQNNQICDDNLYCVSLICHGPTLPIVQQVFIEELTKKYDSRITYFSVKDKTVGWNTPYLHIEFENGSVYEKPFRESDYAYAFGHFSRTSCCNCKFKGEGHISDIILGDYWGISKNADGYNHYGVSAILCRTAKGEELVKNIDATIFNLFEGDPHDIIIHNPMYYRSRSAGKDHDAFKSNLTSKGLRYAVKKDCGFIKYYLMKIKRIIIKNK